jgi:hypothetical protein
VARGVLCAEYFPYHSKSFKKGALLPSQEYTFDLVRRAIERGAVVLLMRSKRLWLDAVPKLVSYDRLFEANSSQCAHVSPNNYCCNGAGGFEEALEALR